MLVYLDANVFIAAVEGEQSVLRSALWRLFDLGGSQELSLMTSELSIAEVLTKPLELGLEQVVAAYSDLMIASGSVAMVPVTREVLFAAAHISANDRSVRLADAIHLATADRTNCSIILTGDKRLGSKRSSYRALSVVEVESIVQTIK